MLFAASAKYHACASISNLSDGYLDDLEKSDKLTVYCGFDPTAESLQLGNLVPFIGLLRLQALGKGVVSLIGGATSLIGDPTGRKDSRLPSNEEACALNSDHFRDTFLLMQTNFTEQFLPNFALLRDPGKFEVINNMDWMKNEKVLNFLQEVAAYLRYQELAHKDSVKLRESYGSGMNMKEFVYPMLQAYDFLHLYQNHDCRLGGNDQIGNIDTGIALIRRKLAGNAFGLTVPLLLAADGTKIGKTTSNNQDDVIWLNPRYLRPFYFFQKVLNLPDKLMTPELLKCLSFFSVEEIEQLLVDQKNNPSRRPAQRALAQELTLLVHGAGCLQASELASRVLYASSSINTTQMLPMLALSEGLSPTERNFLVACLAHYTAPQEGPLPVIHDKAPSDAGPLDRLHEVLKVAISSGCDCGIGVLVQDRGVTLNGHQLLPASSSVKSAGRSCSDCTDRRCLRQLFASSKAAVEEAWQAADPATGLSILQIGKRFAWFIVPFEKVRNY
ncbi:Tyrosine--tRNA ligase [Echinococcus granulosus]|nr:Tyrosine--tRNA ligase [Echinococcus granulosus]